VSKTAPCRKAISFSSSKGHPAEISLQASPKKKKKHLKKKKKKKKKKERKKKEYLPVFFLETGLWPLSPGGTREKVLFIVPKRAEAQRGLGREKGWR